MGRELSENLYKALDRYIHEHGGYETIDGCPVHEAAKSVDLTIAHTPVCPDYIRSPLSAFEVFDHGLPRVLTATPSQDWKTFYLANGEKLSEYSMLEARARYLLLRGYFAKMLAQKELPYRWRIEPLIMARFFPDGLFLPETLVELWAAPKKGSAR